MKTTTLMASALAGFLFFLSVPADTKAQAVSVNFSVFYNELGRYGTWVNSPRYGQVWIYREPGFRPYYSRGRWEYTDMGWAWYSDYEWGWAAFHYGRWEFDDYYGGWIWIPDYEWAPAWVSWSESGDYYGWAPLGFGVNINIGFGSIPYDRWVFCSRPYFNNARFYDHCIPFSSNRTVIRNYTIINNVYGNGRGRYYGGPDRHQAQRYSRVEINPRHIERDYGLRERERGRDRGREWERDRGRFGGNDERRRPVYGSRPDEMERRRGNNEPANNGWGNRERNDRNSNRPEINRSELPRREPAPDQPRQRQGGFDRNNGDPRDHSPRQRPGGFERNNDRSNDPSARQRQGGFDRGNSDSGNGNRGWGNRGTERGGHDNGRRGRG